MKRVQRAFPKDNDRKRMVLQQLFDEYYPEASAILKRQKENEKAKDNDFKNKKAIYEQAISFYERDDVTYQTPGKSDVISVKKDNKRTLMQKRYMTMTMSEAYHLYCEEIGSGTKVGKSKFVALRPQNVMIKCM